MGLAESQTARVEPLRRAGYSPVAIGEARAWIDARGRKVAHQLQAFRRHFLVKGDVIECRQCRRKQQCSWAWNAFEHHAGCPGFAWPWLVLKELAVRVAPTPRGGHRRA